LRAKFASAAGCDVRTQRNKIEQRGPGKFKQCHALKLRRVRRGRGVAVEAEPLPDFLGGDHVASFPSANAFENVGLELLENGIVVGFGGLRDSHRLILRAFTSESTPGPLLAFCAGGWVELVPSSSLSAEAWVAFCSLRRWEGLRRIPSRAALADASRATPQRRREARTLDPSATLRGRYAVMTRRRIGGQQAGARGGLGVCPQGLKCSLALPRVRSCEIIFDRPSRWGHGLRTLARSLGLHLFAACALRVRLGWPEVIYYRCAHGYIRWGSIRS
jgi:hypothetical protein